MKISALCIDGNHRIVDPLKSEKLVRGRVTFNNVKTKGSVVTACWRGMSKIIFIRDDTYDAFTFYDKGFRF